jgi:hypothetical protein
LVFRAAAARKHAIQKANKKADVKVVERLTQFSLPLTLLLNQFSTKRCPALSPV